MPRTDLDNLLEQSLALTAQVEQDLDMPQIERSVPQLEQMSRKFASRSTRTSEASRNQGLYMLASKGYDADRLSRSLHSIDLKTSFEPLEPLAETDFYGYLRHARDLVVLTSIEEAKRETLAQFHTAFESRLEDEWARARRELMDAVGHAGTLASAATGVSSVQDRAVARAAVASYGRRSAIDSKALQYARVVQQLNDQHLSQAPSAAASAFADVASRADEPDIRRAEVVDCWSLLQHMLGERLPGREHSDLTCQVYKDAYARGDVELQTRFIAGARRFLETQYRQLIQTQISNNMRQARRGPVPGTINDIKAFLNIKYERPKDWPSEFEAIVDHYPVWALIYYCMRCGDYDAALQVASEAEAHVGTFLVFLREFVRSEDGRLPDQVWEQVIAEWRRSVRLSRDPYQQAAFNVIGACDVNRSIPGVFATTQDFLWYKLSIVSVGDRALPAMFAPHDYPLSKLQEMLRRFGPDHFSPQGRNPLLYAQVLLMSLQFEHAIQYLATVDALRVEAVHLALTLYYYGVLRVPADPDADLFTCDKSKGSSSARLNVGRLLRAYVRSFAATDPRLAVEYLALIQDPDMRYAYLKDLVLETRNFDVLLGGVEADGSRFPGCIQRFMPAAEVRRLVELSAAESEANGLHDVAITLYDLADDHERVLSILVRQLSQVLSQSNALRDQLHALAKSIDSKYRSTNVYARVPDQQLVATFDLLLNLMHFFDLYRAERLDEALALIESVSVIPLHAAGMQQRVDAFRQLDDAVRRNFADLLLTTMTILYKLYSVLKSRGGVAGQAGGRIEYMARLRDKARALITFAGMIQFRMPGDTTSRLVRMDVMMN